MAEVKAFFSIKSINISYFYTKACVVRNIRKSDSKCRPLKFLPSMLKLPLHIRRLLGDHWAIQNLSDLSNPWKGCFCVNIWEVIVRSLCDQTCNFRQASWRSLEILGRPWRWLKVFWALVLRQREFTGKSTEIAKISNGISRGQSEAGRDR